MRTIETNLYKFNELSEEAKETARDCWKSNGLDEHECECITEDFQYHLEELGLPKDDIRWRLSCSQGDGVAFYGDVDVEEYLTKNKIKTKFKKLFDKDGDLLISNVNIYSNSNHYNHYNTMSLTYNEELHGGYDNPSRQNAIYEFTDHLLAHIKEVSKDFETKGEEQIDYYASNEYVDEMIIANEYEFTEDGDLS